MAFGKYKDAILDLVFEYEDEEESPPAGSAQSTQSGSKTSTPPRTTAVATSPDLDHGSVAKFCEVLRKEVASVRTSGHRAFNEQLATLEGVVSNPKERYKAALKVSGCSPQDLRDSVAAGKQELSDEHEELRKMADTRHEEKIGGAQQQVAQIDRQLAELQQQIAQLNTEKSSLDSGIAQSTRQIERKRQELAAAFDIVHKELDEESGLITANLG